MTGIEIALIAAGIICICASFFISRKQKPEDDGISSPASVSAEIWTEKDEEMVQQRIHKMLSEEQDEAIANVKEQLERMSNEKIMAVDEFSGQILEKISENHKEVVFMYNMLSDKQKDLRKMMEDARVQEQAIREAGRRQKVPTQTVPASPSAPSPEPIRAQGTVPAADQIPEERIPVAPAKPAVAAKKTMENVEVSGRVTQADSLRGRKTVKQAGSPAISKTVGGAQTAISRMEAANAAKRARQNQSVTQQTQAAPVLKQSRQPVQPAAAAGQARSSGQMPVRRPSGGHAAAEPASVPAPGSETPGTENVNQKISKMYKEGKSVLEISRALNMGQGEVKLVIALYGGKKR